MHVLCCGVPAALMLLAAGAGASIGLSVVTRYFESAHAVVHANELWILAASFGFVLIGGWLEWRAHRGRRVSPLFAASLACFVLNASVIWAHRDAVPHAIEESAAAR
ncbi:MAG: hypothetical protein AB7L26_05675 [Hyphomonadaceae bacterium]